VSTWHDGLSRDSPPRTYAEVEIRSGQSPSREGPMAANRTMALALITVIGLVGCSKKEQQETPAPEAAPLAQGERAIKRETWAGEPFKLEDSTEVQVSATLASGPAIDVLVLSESDFNTWNTVVSKGQKTDASAFEPIAELGQQGLSSSFTSPWILLAGGTYYVILDNTSFGATAPPASRSDDIATVDFKVESRSPGD